MTSAAIVTAASVEEQRKILGLSEPESAVHLICAESINPEPVDWLWQGWLPRGKLGILAGDAGTGKTTLAMAIIAIVTTAGRWPDKTPCLSPGNVLVWSGEDDPSDTLVPRLIAAGADLSRIHFLAGVTVAGEKRSFDPSTDFAHLAAALEMIGGADLLVIDPIVSAVSGDGHKANDVRRGLQPVVDYAMKFRCAVLGITHFSKGTTGRSPLERVTGSQAYGALARIVLVAAKEEGDGTNRVLARAKSNIGPDEGGIGYSIELADLPNGIRTSQAVWTGCIDGTARQILGDVETSGEPYGSPLEDAMEFLRGALADGPVSRVDLEKDWIDAGHSTATIRRAKSKLGIAPQRDGFGGSGKWLWALPNSKGAHQKSKDAHLLGVSINEESEHLWGHESGREGFTI